LSSTEFCYSVKYVELNGRNRGDPWSVRQTAVYHQISIETKRSRWIILQPSESTRARLKSVLNDDYRQGRSGRSDCMIPHMVLLSTMVSNWQEYIEYLHSELLKLVGHLDGPPMILFTIDDGSQDEKACFSTVGCKHPHDYPVSFVDCQELQLLHHTLLRSSLLVESGLEVVKGCEDHCRKLASWKATTLCESSLAEIAVYSAQMNSHRRDIHRVIEQLKGTSNLVCYH